MINLHYAHECPNIPELFSFKLRPIIYSQNYACTLGSSLYSYKHSAVSIAYNAGTIWTIWTPLVGPKVSIIHRFYCSILVITRG